MSAQQPADRDAVESTAIDAAATADEALRLVGIDAALAETQGLVAVQQAKASRNTAAESKAWRALGLVAKDRGDLVAAESHLRKAVVAGRRGGAGSAAEARMTLAFVLLERGELVAARRLARGAVAALSGRDQARARVQLALIEQRTGALNEALATYEAALTQLRRHGDELIEAKLRNNRGVLLAYRGQAAAAEQNLSRAQQLFNSLGHDLFAADAGWNLGFAAGLRGDVVLALEHFEAAGAVWDKAGMSRGFRFLDSGRVLLSAGLVDAALEAVETGMADLSSRGVGSDLAEAQLLLSEVHLAAGNMAAAELSAREALNSFARQGRTSLVLLAQLALLRATAAKTSEPYWREARSIAEALAGAGWSMEAVDVQLLMTRRHIAAGGEVTSAAISHARKAAGTGPPGQRLRAWHTVALSRLAVGDRSGAVKALAAGLRVHDAHRATLAATELQVHSAARAGELAETGLLLALESGRPNRVLAWSERWRAGSLLSRPVRPPKDEILAARLTELRSVTADLEQARHAGDETTRLQRQQRGLERAVMTRARSVRSALRLSAAVGLPDLQAVLGERALVEFVQVGRQLAAVVVTESRTSLHRLGEAEPMHRELEYLRFGLSRLSAGGSPRRIDASLGSVRAAAERVDGILLAPLLRHVADRPLVLVPTGAMHVLPWGLLAHAADRAVTVAPSASVWFTSRERRARGRGHVLVVAGPGLPGARLEAAMVAKTYGGSAQLLQPEEATVGAVRAALEGAAYAHLATHGSFRADNPLFSSLALGNGALTVYDLEGLAVPPGVVVLSACDSGLSSVHPGDELMGLTGALLRIGTRSLVASVAPVPDEVAQRTMVAFHAALQSGAPPAVALHRARASLNDEDRLRAGSFVCFGAG